MCMCVRVSVFMCMRVQVSEKARRGRMSDLLELELQAGSCELPDMDCGNVVNSGPLQ